VERGAASLRRLALVSEPGREAEAAFAWMGTLPSGGVWRGDDLGRAPLERLDLLWVRSAAIPEERLRSWLEAGGRLLLCGAAVSVPTALGLERLVPVLLPHDQSDRHAELQLAGFGPHPLFTGLRDGARVGAVSATPLGYESTRPEGAVVAVERREFTVSPSRVLAWEYAVGAGGMLCLGAEPSLLYPDPDIRREAEIVLANALVGDAVPHRNRPPGTATWPTPGGQARVASSESPLLLVPDDPWPGSTLPAYERPPAAAWTKAGRRLMVSARPPDGRREVWAPPVRVMHAAGVRGATPCAPARIAADEVSGGLALGGHRLLERWAPAADAPAVVWEIAGHEGLPVLAEWMVDLRRAWPYAEGAYGELTATLAGDRRSLSVEAAAGPRALYAVSTGTLTVESMPGIPRVRVRCEATAPLRIVAAAGMDEAELRRAVAVLARDGASRLAMGRTRRAAQLHRYGTGFEVPDEALVRAFDWARERGDEALIGVPGVGRSALVACPGGAGEGAWCFGAQACSSAGAQLAAGNREPARELLRFLAQCRHPSGGIPALLPLGGLASPPAAVATVAFLELAERYAAWTADDETVRRLREPLVQALEWLASAMEAARLRSSVLDAIEALIEPAGPSAIARLRARPPSAPAHEDDPLAVMEAAAASLRRAPGELPGSGAAAALLDAVAALWGLEPNAPEDAVTVTPLLPPAWRELALRRLRVGRSTIDLELRLRGETATLRVRHAYGPRLVVTAGLRGRAVASVDVDDIPMPASRVRFESYAEHEIRFHLL
jgi:hypothetical protein